MKEFYLIPKHTYDVENKKDNKNMSVEWKTNVPPPVRKLSPPSNQSLVPLRKIEYEDVHEQNPPISDLLPIVFKKINLPQARSILNYFAKSTNIKWDVNGDLLYPLQKGNIIEIIQLFLSKKNTFSSDEISDIKYIVNSSNIPLWLINNPHLKKHANNDDYDDDEIPTASGAVQSVVTHPTYTPQRMQTRSTLKKLRSKKKEGDSFIYHKPLKRLVKTNTWTSY